MCNYSLEDTRNRPARVGDQLVTRPLGRYNHTGLVHPDDLKCAVCVPDGARVIITGLPTAIITKIGGALVNTATMRVVDVPEHGKMDVVVFDNVDNYVLLGDFEEGVQFSIEMLPDESAGVETKSQEPVLA